MNSDNPSSQQQDRLSRMIDTLLAENTFLKQVITALLPNGRGLPEAEMDIIKTLVAGGDAENSIHLPQTGNNEMNISSLRPTTGKNETGISSQHPIPGNYQFNNSNDHVQSGNNEMNISTLHIQDGNFPSQLDVVRENIRPLMKTANRASCLTTARVLIQLAADPATPLRDLRKLTGLSEDGMAKRIMAMKKAGLIVKLSAPKRFLLTEKAKTLFIKIWR